MAGDRYRALSSASEADKKEAKKLVKYTDWMASSGDEQSVKDRRLRLASIDSADSYSRAFDKS